MLGLGQARYRKGNQALGETATFPANRNGGYFEATGNEFEVEEMHETRFSSVRSESCA